MVNDRKERHSIWLANEDIHDADEPYLPALLEEAFLEWSAEASGMTAFRSGQYGIYGKDAKCHGSAGASESSTLAGIGIEEIVQTAVRSVLDNLAFYSTEYGEWFVAGTPIFRRHCDKLFAILVYVAPAGTQMGEGELGAQALHYRGCFYRVFERVYVKDLLLTQERSSQESSRRDELFQAAKRLYDQIDVTSVLNEMLRSLETLYPQSEVYLYLSQDYVEGDPRIRPLVFKNTAHDIVAKAFLDGNPAKEKDRDGNTRVAIPLSGKQAAYGVLCITISAGKRSDELDLPAFLLIADTAGSAFENAKLYEQSNLLINELRLINDMTKRLNQSLKLREIFQFATTELLTIFDADYCCVLQLNPKKDVFEVKSSNIPSMASETFSPEYGFCGMIYRTKEPLIISDYWNTRVVSSRLMDNTGSRSLIAAPIFGDGEVIGVILVTHKQQNFFSYENYKLLQVMSTHIGLAVTNASLHAEVRRMVITDNLTGLHARHYLDEQIQRRQRKDPFGSLILVDIDLFKRVNDTYGHQVGDRILIQVSRIIAGAIRQDDIAARWGGEELAIYLPGVRTEQALRVAERIRKQVAEETEPSVTVSCGVSEWTFDQEKVSVESLFYRADMALYEAKNKGRNCIIVGSST
ncbi:GGDEF domain-containing protein [Paenibacillus agaridevorans]|uniref:GGDEF domain-containing protein n=1 Tax=Paenibacillus agaridevorans TaxID=171404 RepID=A0A2R5EL20_9BACL|nr:sensor domain-containing diguanylate cyclase [Paenibacillus agaridevorans]GBG06329.1 GGDEF domain-containing protein [Paenibacillus agaridevorans]